MNGYPVELDGNETVNLLESHRQLGLHDPQEAENPNKNRVFADARGKSNSVLLAWTVLRFTSELLKT